MGRSIAVFSNLPGSICRSCWRRWQDGHAGAGNRGRRSRRARLAALRLSRRRCGGPKAHHRQRTQPINLNFSATSRRGSTPSARLGGGRRGSYYDEFIDRKPDRRIPTERLWRGALQPGRRAAAGSRQLSFRPARSLLAQVKSAGAGSSPRRPRSRRRNGWSRPAAMPSCAGRRAGGHRGMF